MGIVVWHTSMFSIWWPAYKFITGGGGGGEYKGAPGDFAPEMQKRALKNKKEPLKIAIDCNVKACSMLQI